MRERFDRPFLKENSIWACPWMVREAKKQQNQKQQKHQKQQQQQQQRNHQHHHHHHHHQQLPPTSAARSPGFFVNLCSPVPPAASFEMPPLSGFILSISRNSLVFFLDGGPPLLTYIHGSQRFLLPLGLLCLQTLEL
jgi:hypothetical protein